MEVADVTPKAQPPQQNREIAAPADLKGKNVGAAVREAPLNSLLLFARNANFDVRKVSIINMAPPRKVSVPFVLTETTKSKGLGYIDDSKMQATLDVIRSYRQLDRSIDPSNIYTMQFLPKVSVN